MLPASTFDQGPLGLEGIHRWRGLFSMNHKQAGYPRAKVLRIMGLRTKPESDDNRAPNTGRTGETIYPTMQRGKNVTYEGVLQALDLPSLRVLQTNMLSAFSPMEEGKMDIFPPAARGGPTFTAFARCLECDIPDEFTRDRNSVPSPFQLDFTVTLRMHVPEFFDLGNPVTKVTVGTDPNTDVANPSKAPTYPTLQVPFTLDATTLKRTVVVYNDTIPAKLQFDALETAGTLYIDFLARTATVGGVDVIHFLNDVESNWWDEAVPGLVAGNNIIRQTGGSQITTTFYPTVW